MVGTNVGLYLSTDYKHFNIASEFSDIKVKFIARFSNKYWTSFDYDTSYYRTFANYYKRNITNYGIRHGIFESAYSLFDSPPPPGKEIVHCQIISEYNTITTDDPNIYYWGTDNGLVKRNWEPITTDVYLPFRKIYKLHSLTYFPEAGFEQYFIFLGTDSGLYVNKPHKNFYFADSITLVPNTSHYKIMDIDGSECDNSLWLATDKGLVRLQLNYDANNSLNKNVLKRSIEPKGKTITCKNYSYQIPLYAYGDSVQWLKDGVAIPGATESKYETKVPGKYSAIVSRNFCNYHISDTTMATEIAYNDTIDFSFDYPDTVHICKDQTQNFIVMSYSVPLTFIWYRNGIPFYNKELWYLDVSEEGYYKVELINCNMFPDFLIPYSLM
jgi:hypothetical protein